MKRLLVLSGKGGTGKTTIAAALTRLANVRAAADCDVDAPNLHLVMDCKGEPEVADFTGGEKARIDPVVCTGCKECEVYCRFDAIYLMEGKAAVNEYVCEGCGVCQFVCPANAVSLDADIAGKRELYLGERVFSTASLKMGRGNSGKLVTEVKMAMLKHAPDCELAIIDGSPGIGCPVISSISGMDLVLVVAEASESGISDLKRLVKTADTFQVKLAVCVNKYDTSPAHTRKIEEFCTANGLVFAGKIPFDREAVKAVNAGITIADIDCISQKAVKEIYKKVTELLKDEQNQI